MWFAIQEIAKVQISPHLRAVVLVQTRNWQFINCCKWKEGWSPKVCSCFSFPPPSHQSLVHFCNFWIAIICNPMIITRNQNSKFIFNPVSVLDCTRVLKHPPGGKIAFAFSKILKWLFKHIYLNCLFSGHWFFTMFLLLAIIVFNVPYCKLPYK